MRDLVEGAQQDTDVAVATDLHQPTYTEDEVAFIEQVYRNSRVEEVEVVDETDRDIVRVLNSGEGCAIGGGGGDAFGDAGGDAAIVPPPTSRPVVTPPFSGRKIPFPNVMTDDWKRNG